MDFLIPKQPEAVTATGQAHLNGHVDVAYITVYFPHKTIAHINVNWLSPVKVRTTLIGGEKKMLVWNDLEVDEKIKIYDKGVQMSNGQGLYDLMVSYRSVTCGPLASSKPKPSGSSSNISSTASRRISLLSTMVSPVSAW